MLDVNCPSCQKLLQVAETAVDRDSQCPACATTFRPVAVWRGDSPMVTSAPASRMAFVKPEWSPELEDAESELDLGQMAQPAPIGRAPNIGSPADPEPGLFGFIRVGIIGFVAGCGVGIAFMIRMQTAFPGRDLDLSVVPVMGVLTVIHAAAYAFLLACINDPMHRRIVRISGRSTIGIVCAGYLYCFFIRHPSEPFVLAVTWFTPVIAIGCYLFTGIAWKTLIGIRRVRDGLLKAAGRPTRPATRDRLRCFFDDDFDEDQP